MNHHCVCLNFSLRCEGHIPFSFSDYNYCLNGQFVGHPLLFSSPVSPLSSCCTCCANSVYRVPTCPRYLYGLRQSTLIQWSPCKKQSFVGLDRRHSRVPVRKSSCERFLSIKETDVCGRRGSWGKGRFGGLGSGKRFERRGLCDFDEAEVMLSLLTDEVDEECIDRKERTMRSYKEQLAKQRNISDVSYKHKKKSIDSSVLESKSRFEYETVVTQSRENERRRKEERREDVSGALLRRQNRTARARKEAEELLLRQEQGKHEKESLLRREEHKERLRKDGSSCSSYYSLSLTDELESDSDVQVEEEQLVSNRHEKDSKWKEEVSVYGEAREGVTSHKDCAEHQEVVLKQENNELGSYVTSSGIESGWRKKSEKRLADISIEEMKSEKELLEKQAGFSDIHGSVYGKVSGSYRRNDEKSTLKLDERTREHHQQIGNAFTKHSQKGVEYTEISKMPENDPQIQTSAGYEKIAAEEISTKATNSAQESNKVTGVVTSEEEYRRNLYKYAEKSKTQEFDISGTSVSQLYSETRMKKKENSSTKILNSGYDPLVQHPLTNQLSGLEDPRYESQFLTRDAVRESIPIPRRQPSRRIPKNEETSSLSYGSTREQHPLVNEEDISGHESRKGIQEITNVITNISVTQYSGNATSVVDYGDQNISGTAVITPASQATGSLQGESSSGISIGETPGESLLSGSASLQGSSRVNSPVLENEIYGGAREGDALSSAEQLQKSSAQNVNEFLKKVRQEISSSEVVKEKKTYETRPIYEAEQIIIGQHGSEDSQMKEHESTHSSQGSGEKGPSDEMWDVSVQQVTHMSKPPKDAGSDGNDTVKRTGRTLWNIIADIVRFRWASHSENHSSVTKSGRRSSPNPSRSAEAWFSGSEPEENKEEKVKKKRKTIKQGSEAVDQEQGENVSIQNEDEGFSLSSSRDEVKYEGGYAQSSPTVSGRDSASKSIHHFSGQESLGQNSGGTFSEIVVAESSISSPALRLRKSPVVEEISVAEETVTSGGKEQLSSVSLEISGLENKDGELKRKKLQRTDQVLKDRFDKWEEAYRIEAEQRKNDEVFMREALLEARKAADNWEVPVGAVLVQGGKIIARGCNLVEELRDSTAHAEMICIREASNILRTWRLSETTLYITLEPCPMCAGAILQARVDTVVWGAPNKLLGADGSWIRLFPSEDDGSETSDKPPAPLHPFHPRIAIRRGVLSAECAEVMQQFFQLRRRKKEKQPDPPSSPPSRLPVSHHPSKFLSKVQDAFHIMLCL